jgi:hypothetical protein
LRIGERPDAIGTRRGRRPAWHSAGLRIADFEQKATKITKGEALFLRYLRLLLLHLCRTKMPLLTKLENLFRFGSTKLARLRRFPRCNAQHAKRPKWTRVGQTGKILFANTSASDVLFNQHEL